MKKQQALQAELAGHDSRITVVTQTGEQMIQDGHFASDDIQHKIQGLNDRWQSLKVKLLINHNQFISNIHAKSLMMPI